MASMSSYTICLRALGFDQYNPVPSRESEEGFQEETRLFLNLIMIAFFCHCPGPYRVCFRLSPSG